jgi:type IV pilus assembly protein PilE
MRTAHYPRGFTLAEVLTALVVVVVLAAIAIPSWRTHLLRARRGDASAALLAVQAAQDRFFARHARYASGPQLTTAAPGGLGLKDASEKGFYRLEVRTSIDGLGYSATARVIPGGGQAGDSRCVEFRIDEHAVRVAVDAEGADRSQDCWR